MEEFYVNVWEETVTIPTYGVGKPDKNPMFFEKRIYQGSSGAVYPNAIIEKIFDEKENRDYKGLFLENKYLKLMILPELGGRIHMAYDKIRNRHFIYYNQVIKPALVGLTGPWISGGIEFNWPQHHRPSTFEPVDYLIRENEDGSKTIMVNEVERMFHTKGLASFTLYPEKAYIEISAKLINRSALPQTFLWWANPAVKVNDHYQSVFPPDVNAVFDHGKRDVSAFPIATGTYYKVDYSPGTDISRYKNIPVPTSYMAINSEYDFMGGYEHDTRAGLLHVANHHVSPGKKQWTWGHSDFGQAWDRNLTDEDGPYIELMTGMFTDNQPDFTWLMPNEEKSFRQYFLPYSELGMVKNATKDILIAVDTQEDLVIVKIYVTAVQKGIHIRLSYKDKLIAEAVADIDPANIYSGEFNVAGPIEEEQLLLILYSVAGKELIKYAPALNKKNKLPEPAKAASDAGDLENTEQLFLTGQHLEQYRHATYSPVPYYQKALAIDPGDIRNNNALGLWYLRRGQFAKSEAFFKRAITTLTLRNPNPCDTEPYYNLGLCKKYLGHEDQAYDAFYKSTWGNGWKASGYFAVAQIDINRGDAELAIEHLSLSLANNANNGKAYVLKSAAYRKLGQYDAAEAVAGYALERDPFNLGAFYELSEAQRSLQAGKDAIKELLLVARGYDQSFITYALDYAAAGLYPEAAGLLSNAINPAGTSPMVYYHLAFFYHKMKDAVRAISLLEKASAADPYLCFPNRLEEIHVLKLASELNTADAKAPYYLGNLFYDKRQYEDAISCWELSARLDSSFPTVLRNLGIASFNKRHDREGALRYFENAFGLDSTDARVLMELDQLYKRLNRKPEDRLQFLEDQIKTANLRDDVYLERIVLLNFAGQHEIALELIMGRQFHPWEGGEGKVSGQYVHTLTELAKKEIRLGNFGEAIDLLERAQHYPHQLGEGKLFGIQENDIFYWLGLSYEGIGNREQAVSFFRRATVGLHVPSAAVFYNDQQPDKIFYQGLAWRKLGKLEKATEIFDRLVVYGKAHQNDHVQIDYFAVSLPNLLIFEDDMDLRNRTHCLFMQGLGYLGLKRGEEAKAAFSAVLTLDAAHLGAKSYLDEYAHLSEN